MNKLFTSIAVASLSLTMAVGVGVAVNQSSRDAVEARAIESSVYNLDGSTKGTGNSYTATNSATVGGIGWSVQGNAEQTPWRIGTSKNTTMTNTERSISSKTTLASATTDDITKVVVSLGTKQSAVTVNSITIKVGSTAEGSSDISTETISSNVNASNASVTFNRPSGTSWASRYFTFVLNLSGSAGSSAIYVQFAGAVFYADVSSSYTVTYDANGGSGEMADSTGASIILPSPTFTAPTNMDFLEWNTQADGEGTGYNPGDTVTADLDLYAIWFDPYIFSGNSITFSNQNLTDQKQYSSAFHSSVFSVQFSGGANDGKYYSTGAGMRTYKNGGSITITAVTGTLTDISFTWSESYKPTSTKSSVSTGEMSSDFTSWSGSSSSVTLTYTSSGNNDDPWRLQALVVTTANVMEVMDTSYNVSSSFEVIKTTGELVLYGHDTTAPAQTVLSGLSWSTQDTSIISIDGATNYCTVTGLAVGNATLTMSKSGYADVDVTITVTGGAIEMIVVEGTLTQSEYEVGDSWSHAGLTVTGLYESGDEVDLTNDSRIEWEYYANGSLSTSAALGNTSLVARAIFDELHDDSAAKSITVSEHQASGPIPSGRYYIMNYDLSYGMSNAATSSAAPAAISMSVADNQLIAFDVLLVDDNTYEISTTISETKYYLINNSAAASSSNNNVRIITAPTVTLVSTYWVLEEASAGYYVKQNTTGTVYRYLSYNTDNAYDFRGYTAPKEISSTSKQDSRINFVAEKSYAESVADKILESCTSRGSSSYDTTAWGNASTAYAAITIEAEKNFLINGSAVKDSTVKLERALEQYDYAVSRYEGIDAFITGRDGIYGLANNASLFAGISTEATTAIIVVVALTSVTAIGAIFFIRRRKYN